MAPLSIVQTVPRIFRSELTNRWARDSRGWSPKTLLSTTNLFPASLTIKRSRRSRFFMYEEHADDDSKLHDADGPTEIIRAKPSKLADLMSMSMPMPMPMPTPLSHEHISHGQPAPAFPSQDGGYYYWTSPVSDISPSLLTTRLQGYETLHNNNNNNTNANANANTKTNATKIPSSPQLDPRGPSLWMASSGSSTQAHYDIADNILVQLHGSKRIRCYPPSAATHLHLFPDAHPRARKSQVNFDHVDTERYPFFHTLAPPVLDALLRPGDAIRIPAFWFHHVENGRFPGTVHGGDVHGARGDGDTGDDGPSLSMNLFALSGDTPIAQGIFHKASRPFGAVGGRREQRRKRRRRDVDADAENDRSPAFPYVALQALGVALIEGIGGHAPLSPEEFIRTALIETRYDPLRGRDGRSSTGVVDRAPPCGTGGLGGAVLTDREREVVEACVARVLPDFRTLQSVDDTAWEDRKGMEVAVYRYGIAHLVALHLLELWAVELVGAHSIAEAWDAALSGEWV